MNRYRNILASALLGAAAAIAAGLLPAGTWPQPSTAAGGTQASAIATVTVDVQPAVSVQPVNPLVDLGPLSPGDHQATATFRVQANQPQVALYAAVSALHHGGPADGAGSTIPLNMARGVVISPLPAAINAVAAPRPGGPGPETVRIANFVSAAHPIDGFPAEQTQLLTLQGSQAGGFSQEIGLTVAWSHDDSRRPSGSYVGRVRLVVLVLPE